MSLGHIAIIFALMLLLPLPLIQQAEAYKISHSIGIILSQTCLRIIKYHLVSSCPTYEDLANLDTSNQEWSGRFFVDDNGVFKRGNAPIKNSWLLYEWAEKDTWRIFVDPPHNSIDKIKLVFIETSFDTYYDRGHEFDSEGNRVLYHDRYVNSGCTEAIVNAKKWKEFVPDTINYLRNGCDPQHTSFNHIQLIPQKITPQDITTSYKYKHDKWIQYVKQYCIYKFKAC